MGKSETCALRIDDPMVSRRHLSLDPNGTRLRITDLGSANGTRVDGLVARLIDRHAGDLDRAARAAGVGRRYLNMLRSRSR
ncbi:MAG TPA: FHA domain-containing protein [Polyangiaceae bacterium]|nr:FHA domain-containing protein [Polyangiaceae bacterium]